MSAALAVVLFTLSVLLYKGARHASVLPARPWWVSDAFVGTVLAPVMVMLVAFGTALLFWDIGRMVQGGFGLQDALAAGAALAVAVLAWWLSGRRRVAASAEILPFPTPVAGTPVGPGGPAQRDAA